MSTRRNKGFDVIHTHFDVIHTHAVAILDTLLIGCAELYLHAPLCLVFNLGSGELRSSALHCKCFAYQAIFPPYRVWH